MTRYYGWPPSEVGRMTVRRLLWWGQNATRQVGERRAAAAKAIENARKNRR